MKEKEVERKQKKKNITNTFKSIAQDTKKNKHQINISNLGKPNNMKNKITNTKSNKKIIKDMGRRKREKENSFGQTITCLKMKKKNIFKKIPKLHILSKDHPKKDKEISAMRKKIEFLLQEKRKGNQKCLSI